MKISLVINTYNRLHILPNALDAVQRLRYSDFEVIVVDGPSTDGTMDYLKKNWSEKVKILSCPEANLSMSRNIGILAAQGDIVAFTDDDGIPEPDWFDKIVPAYQNELVGAVGGFVRNHTGVEFQTKHIRSSRDGNSEVNIENASDIVDAVVGGWDFPGMIGVNSTFRRKYLLEVGGFDFEYAYYLDETDVIVRLVDAGYKISVIPDAEVHHKYARSHIRTEKGLPRTWLPIARSTAYFCIRNKPAGVSMSKVFGDIEQHRLKYIQHTQWALSVGGITSDEAKFLLKSLKSGLEDGVKDAFSFPWRRVIDQLNCPSLPWLLFPKLLPTEKRRRIAFVTELYPPRPCGGVAVFMHQLAKRLAADGHEITVITFCEAGRPHTVDMEDGVWVHRLPSDTADRIESDVTFIPEGVRAVSERVLAELERVQLHRNIEWVVGTIWDLHIASVIASGKYRVAMYLVTSYGLMLDSKPEWRANQHYFVQHVQKMIEGERWALNNVDLILSSTNAIRRDVESVYGLTLDSTKTVIQPFGIKPPEYTASPAIPDSTIRLVFVGRFEVRKGIVELLEVIPQLLVKNENLLIKLVGDNTLPSSDGTSHWDKFVSRNSSQSWFDRVMVTGVISDSDLERSYEECDIFVAPSRYESFGLIYVEAMRYGKPCVGCKVGGIPEVVADGQTGILVPVNNPQALLNAIQSLISDPELRKKYGNAGIRRYKDKFTIDAFAKGFLNKLG